MLMTLALLLAAGTIGEPEWRTPPGFVVREHCDHSTVPDITCLTIDPKGRIVVAGPGYIRVLLEDEKKNGIRAVDLVTVRESAQGLLREGDALYAVVDGGLWRWPLDPEGTKADGPGEKLLSIRTGGEHHAHAVHRGPDGWLYVMVGDGTGISATFVNSPSSPVRDPIGGCLIRLSPDGKSREIVADGFRNAYDFAFDRHGFAWTFDSDNERCVSLPWYEPTRVYRIIPGTHHGWRAPQLSDAWRAPPYFFDVAAPETTCGRGSPTGVVWQTHPSWPARFQGLLLADWTFGTIWLYRPGTAPQRFLEPQGDAGFAPTALAVHPHTGDLFVSIGGRGTRGAVYRVSPPRVDRPEVATWPLPDWAEQARQLVERRTRAAFPRDDDERSAWEAASRTEHRTVLYAAAELLAQQPETRRQALHDVAQTPNQLITLADASLRTNTPAAIDLARQAAVHPQASVARRLDAWRVIQRALGDITSPKDRASVWAGYTLRYEPPPGHHVEIRRLLRETFPTGHADLDRELSRTLALLGDDDPGVARKVVHRLTPDSDPIDDVHYLIVLSRLSAPWDDAMRSAIAEAMLGLDRKLIRRGNRRDRHWSLRLVELHRELARCDARLNRAIVAHPEFGRPDHVIWTRCPRFDRQAAAERFLAQAEQDPAWSWTEETVSLLADLPTETSQRWLRRLAGTPALRDAALPLLARHPIAEDRELFREGLLSHRPEVVRASVEALRAVGPLGPEPKLLAAMIRSGKQLPAGRQSDELRRLLSERLQSITGQRHGLDFSRWSEWLASEYPQEAAESDDLDGVKIERWRKRLALIDWSQGDAERGRLVFQKAQCASCHGGSQALGPDLTGVGQRFSREDRLTAIVQPNRDVPARYRMTRIETTDGRTYQGLVVYEAADGIILQVGAAETVRLSESRIESRQPTDRSMMPAGLLDNLTDAEIADLDAYLRSLRR